MLEYVIWILLALFQVPPSVFFWILVIVALCVCGGSCLIGVYAITVIPALVCTIFGMTTCATAHTARSRLSDHYERI